MGITSFDKQKKFLNLSSINRISKTCVFHIITYKTIPSLTINIKNNSINVSTINFEQF